MPCQAKRRARHQLAGWTCTGTDLVSVMEVGPAGDRIPIVVPRGALELVMNREHALGYDVQEFAGGDHFHLCLTPVEAADYAMSSA